MDIIRRRQLEARMALAMKELKEDYPGEIVKTEDGYDWLDKDGEIVISMKNV